MNLKKKESLIFKALILVIGAVFFGLTRREFFAPFNTYKRLGLVVRQKQLLAERDRRASWPGKPG